MVNPSFKHQRHNNLQECVIFLAFRYSEVKQLKHLCQAFFAVDMAFQGWASAQLSANLQCGKWEPSNFQDLQYSSILSILNKRKSKQCSRPTLNATEARAGAAASCSHQT